MERGPPATGVEPQTVSQAARTGTASVSPIPRPATRSGARKEKIKIKKRKDSSLSCSRNGGSSHQCQTTFRPTPSQWARLFHAPSVALTSLGNSTDIPSALRPRSSIPSLWFSRREYLRLSIRLCRRQFPSRSLCNYLKRYFNPSTSHPKTAILTSTERLPTCPTSPQLPAAHCPTHGLLTPSLYAATGVRTHSLDGPLCSNIVLPYSISPLSASG
ncbi:uncharacterized protein K452DRAFT_291389 [Aplosporella prunicola CBS 121167]|uniref:Uncharacterized protein n=1 Tax=Aplosporella prunicola CBS 121167 TaxID=1176127 RepID=A0A6A6B2X2_9PEZI|nr:uncharacterized protein K452DRAFT_291389 [Aplosporella prunicola CBS 121167]KAF2137574.1 hypothetical protein K452DRAFT_291389 [Aplosporella prunicola CBS 121167]